ncbi:hypothetical protein CDAR_67231 [Caerostris darwini]|uniref:Uncharacterized protein n=1 Tax=Caerostris darwini TaxID=1538125 RepID=A0AAV4TXF0_9ARAC|nr:hypothetical protein CDAR_67231 [Caerostris darwini]
MAQSPATKSSGAGIGFPAPEDYAVTGETGPKGRHNTGQQDLQLGQDHDRDPSRGRPLPPETSPGNGPCPLSKQRCCSAANWTLE